MSLHFPFQPDHRGRSAEADDATHLRDMIEQVLFTVPGERVNRPDFGCGLLQLVFAPNSDTLGYLSAALGLRDGQLDGFRIVPSSLVTDGHVLVVSRGAADVYTLPGSPIRAEALNIANGGIDIGFFGYGGFQIKNAAGIVDVAPYSAA